MRRHTFRDALREALDEELARDERVVVFGEDIAAAGGVFQVTRGLADKYGPKRVFDTPISELALAGCAFGSAVMGLRPVIEIMFGDFIALAADSLINQASKYHWLSNGQAVIPMVIRTTVGAGGRFGAIHSQSPAPWFLGVPGMKIVAPSTCADAKALLKSAIRDDEPVLFLEHKQLYNLRDQAADTNSAVDTGDVVEPLGRARVLRSGRDVTVVSAMKTVHTVLEAADVLARDHEIAAEVIDLRTLKPLDVDTVAGSVATTRRMLVVEEGPLTGGWAGEVVARVAEAVPDAERLWRLAMPDLPLPYSPPLEDAFLPSVSTLVDSVLRHIEGRAASVSRT